MSWARPLYELQETELKLEEQEKALAQVEKELRDDSKLRAAQQELKEQEEALAKLQQKQRSAEWDLRDLRSKIELLEKKLYGGKIANPKELMSLEQEIEQYKRLYQKKEDELLEILVKAEEFHPIIERKRSQLKEVEAEWSIKCQHLSLRRQELTEAISIYRQKLKQQLELLDSQRLEFYQQVKRSAGIAKVEAGRCGGCWVSLSLAEVQRARTQPIYCPNCRKLLYIP